MRYAQIRSMDISNGEGVGVSLFVQGCDRHCFNCFNSETWDFKSGKEWTEDIKNKFIQLIDRPYIKRVSFLGGEPLHENNLKEVLSLIEQIRSSYPEKSIWLYTGFEWSGLVQYDSYNKFIPLESYLRKDAYELYMKRHQAIELCDIVIDGEYIDEQKDLTLAYRGSRNQNVIDVKQSLAQNKMVLYCD